MLVESTGLATVIPCGSAGEVKRVVQKQGISLVICGFKFQDQSSEELFGDLPLTCPMLMIARQNLLDYCYHSDIYKLPSPVKRGDFHQMLSTILALHQRMERYTPGHRSKEEEEMLSRTKVLLMEYHGITEEKAHRFLQKRSMDSGQSLMAVVQSVWDEYQ